MNFNVIIFPTRLRLFTPHFINKFFLGLSLNCKYVWVIIKIWRNLCPIRFSRIRNFNFLVFLSIILSDVLCNTNKTLSNVSGDFVRKRKLKQTHFSRFLQCPNVGVGSFNHLQLFQKHINTCLVLVNTYDFIEVKSITNVSNNEVVESGCMCYRLSLK